MKVLWPAILFTSASLTGQVVDYDFDGDLSSVLVESQISDNTFPVQQVAGRLIYHNNSQLVEDSTTLMELVSFNPTKNDSWSLQVDVTLPVRMRLPEKGQDAEFFVGIGCYNNKDETLRFFTTEINVGEPWNREAKASIGVGDDEPWANQFNIPVLQESVQMKVTYFGGQFTLFNANLGSGSDFLFRADIDPGGFSFVPEFIQDWGLETTDEFTLFLVAHSNNYPISPERPVQFDNLYAIQHFTDTVDGGITQKPDLMSVEVKAFPDGISELQKSHDLENWITIKTLARGIRETLFLPSDNGNAYYRVVKFD